MSAALKALQVGTLEYEFPDYPATDVPAFTADMQAQHWHNDICPSWPTTASNGDVIEVYVDFGDVALREIQDPDDRFTVLLTPFGATHPACCVLQTEDEAAVVAYLWGAQS